MTFEQFQSGMRKEIDRKECCWCGGLFSEEEGTVWQGKFICFRCLRYDDNIDQEEKSKIVNGKVGFTVPL